MGEPRKNIRHLEVDLKNGFDDDALRHAVARAFMLDVERIDVLAELAHSTPGFVARVELIEADTAGWTKQTVGITDVNGKQLTQNETNDLLVSLCAELGTEIVRWDSDFRDRYSEHGQEFWVTADGAEEIDIERDYDTERILWFRSKESDYEYTDPDFTKPDLPRYHR